MQEIVAHILVMAKHPRIGASSVCPLKLIPDDLFQMRVHLCL